MQGLFLDSKHLPDACLAELRQIIREMSEKNEPYLEEIRKALEQNLKDLL